MIRSMTGYGTGSCRTEEFSVQVEARTVNHRFLDLHVRAPREYLFLEPQIHQLVRSLIRRGRVDINVSIDGSNRNGVSVDVSAARNYMEAADRLRKDLALNESLDLRTLLSLPGVLRSKDADSSLGVTATIAASEMVIRTVRQALEGILDMRTLEGKSLQQDLGRYLDSIAERTKEVRALVPAAVRDYRQRLEDRLAQILPLNGFDPQRVAQEIALFAERSDVSEELARLESHLHQFSEWLNSSHDEVGKKMDFLLQEMQREINTVLSKTAHVEITRSGVVIKADIEKLREQVQNIE